MTRLEQTGGVGSGSSALRKMTRAMMSAGLASVGLASPAAAQDIEEPLTSPGSARQLTTVPDFITLRTTLATSYDSNVLRGNDLRGPEQRDNLRVTPAASLALRRRFGRASVSVSAVAGYDFNTRFSALNRTRIGVDAGGRLRVGGRCALQPRAEYQRLQTDVGDLQRQRGNTTEIQQYELIASCPERVGFAPYLSVEHRESNNSGDRADDGQLMRAALNTETDGITGGVQYYRPSLGSLLLFGNVRRIRRPNLPDVVGVTDRTMVTQFGATLSRSVSPRLAASLSASLLEVDPQRAGVRGYTGAGYNARVTYRPVPRFSVTGRADRSANGQGSISASYVLSDRYAAASELRLSARSAVALGASRSIRRFRGEGVAGFLPRGTDRTNEVSGRYSFDLPNLLRLSASVSHRDRDSDNDFFDYRSTVGTLSVSTQF